VQESDVARASRLLQCREGTFDFLIDAIPSTAARTRRACDASTPEVRDSPEPILNSFTPREASTLRSQSNGEEELEMPTASQRSIAVVCATDRGRSIRSISSCDRLRFLTGSRFARRNHQSSG